VRGRRLRLGIVAAGAAVVAVGVLAFVSYGGTDHSGSTGTQVRSWASGAGLGQSIGTLMADTDRVRAALARHAGGPVLHTDCAVLVTDAESANGELPSPDGQLTTLLSDGYTLAYEAGNDCYDSGGTNPSLIERSTRERIKAEAELEEAVALVGQLTHAPLSTTTTTQPGGGSILG